MSTLLLFPSVIHRVPPSFDFKDRKKEIVEYEGDSWEDRPEADHEYPNTVTG